MMSTSAKGGTLEAEVKGKDKGKGEKVASTTPESAKKQVTYKVSDNNIKKPGGKKSTRPAHADVVSNCLCFIVTSQFI